MADGLLSKLAMNLPTYQIFNLKTLIFL